MLSQGKLEIDTTLLADNTVGKCTQSINLIRFISKQQEVRLPFKQILQISALMFIVFLGYFLYSYLEQIVLDKRIAKLQLQTRESEKEINSERIRKMQELMKSGVIRTVLHAQRSKNGSGFSNYLETIATACPHGVWLTSINVNKRSNSTILSGKAYRPNNIVQLVNNLNNESLFNNTQFSLTKIEKIEEHITTDDETTAKIIYSFVIQTQGTVGSKT